MKLCFGESDERTSDEISIYIQGFLSDQSYSGSNKPYWRWVQNIVLERPGKYRSDQR